MVEPSTTSQPYRPVHIRDSISNPGATFKNTETLEGFNCVSEGLLAAQSVDNSRVHLYHHWKERDWERGKVLYLSVSSSAINRCICLTLRAVNLQSGFRMS